MLRKKAYSWKPENHAQVSVGEALQFFVRAPMGPPVSLYLFILRFLFTCPGCLDLQQTSRPRPQAATPTPVQPGLGEAEAGAPKSRPESTCPGPALLSGSGMVTPSQQWSPVALGSPLSVRLSCGLLLWEAGLVEAGSRWRVRTTLPFRLESPLGSLQDLL